MALHFTENKSNASASAIKTPFLIEDILDRSSMKAANKISFKNHAENQSARNNNAADHPPNNQEKNMRNNNEIQSNDEEYRKLLQSDRYDGTFVLCVIYLLLLNLCWPPSVTLNEKNWKKNEILHKMNY